MMTPILLATALFVASPLDDFDKALFDTWRVARATREGEEAKDVLGHTLRLDGDGFEIKAGDLLLFKGTLEVQKAGESTWRVDVKHTYGDLKGKTWLGVMRLRTDGVLEVCDNAVDPEKPRPEKLESPPGSGTILLEFERAKKP